MKALADLFIVIAAALAFAIVVTMLWLAGNAFYERYRLEFGTWTNVFYKAFQAILRIIAWVRRLIARACRAVFNKISLAYQLIMKRTYVTLCPDLLPSAELKQKLHKDGDVVSALVIIIGILLFLAAVIYLWPA